MALVRREGPDESGVARLVLNRPGKGNSLNEQLLSELTIALREVDEDDGVRVVILAADGAHFCTGIDLSLLGGRVLPGTESPRSRERLRRQIAGMQAGISSPEACRKPVLAAVQGACIGGGVDLIAACDMRYATAGATFSVREVDVGITADLGSLQRLPSIIGHGRAMELALTGTTLSAAEAHHHGLVNAVFPDEERLRAAVLEVARSLAAKPPLALMGTKAMMLSCRGMPLSQGLHLAATWNAAMLDPQEVQIAIANMRKVKNKTNLSKL